MKDEKNSTKTHSDTEREKNKTEKAPLKAVVTPYIASAHEN